MKMLMLGVPLDKCTPSLLDQYNMLFCRGGEAQQVGSTCQDVSSSLQDFPLDCLSSSCQQEARSLPLPPPPQLLALLAVLLRRLLRAQVGRHDAPDCADRVGQSFAHGGLLVQCGMCWCSPWPLPLLLLTSAAL